MCDSGEIEVRVTVFPGAKKEHVEHCESGESCAWRLYVREPAERNMANKRTRELVSELYDVPLGSVQLIAGHRSPKKRLLVRTCV